MSTETPSTDSPDRREGLARAAGLAAAYEGVPVSTIAVGSLLPFDLFTEIDGSILLYRAAGDRFSKEQRNALRESDLRDLLVRRTDLDRYFDYLSGNLLELLRGPPGARPRPSDIIDTSTVVAGRVIERPSSRISFEMACRVIENAIDMTGQTGGVLRCVAEGSASARDLHAHSMRVCFYGLQLAHGLGATDPMELVDLGVGLMLHDLGKTGDPGRDGEDPGTVVDHPGRGLERLADAPFVGTIARDVIAHHHERVDGRGLYGVPAERLSIHARIAAVADAFDRRTVDSSGRTIANSFEALRAMIAEEKGAYDPKLLALFVRALSL